MSANPAYDAYLKTWLVYPKVPDTALVVDRKTGCYFIGLTLIHTDACSCGDYNEDE